MFPVDFSILEHLLDLLICEGTTIDGNLILITGLRVLGRHIQDPVRVDGENDFEICLTLRCLLNVT